MVRATWLQYCDYLCDCGSPWMHLQNQAHHPLCATSCNCRCTKLWCPMTSKAILTALTIATALTFVTAFASLHYISSEGGA